MREHIRFLSEMTELSQIFTEKFNFKFQEFVVKVNALWVSMASCVSISATAKIILPVTQRLETVFVNEAGLEEIVANLVQEAITDTAAKKSALKLTSAIKRAIM